MSPAAKTILLVEDQPDLRVFLSNLLTAGGYHTIYAADKDEGLQQSRDERPDLIIIDMMMPTEQGIRLYRSLKTDTDLNSIPVFMLSSINKRMFFQCHQIQKQCSTKGLPVPQAYIETPPEAEELLSLIRTLIQPGAPESRT